MKIEIDLPDNAENIRCFYEYKGADGETIYAAKVIEGVRFHCVPAKEFNMMWKKATEKICKNCGELDYDYMYGTDPPEYKCEKYGCIVKITDECKGEK